MFKELIIHPLGEIYCTTIKNNVYLEEQKQRSNFGMRFGGDKYPNYTRWYAMTPPSN